MNEEKFEKFKGKIIDFRLRPPTEPYKGFFYPEIVKMANTRSFQEVPKSYQKSLEGEEGSKDQEALEILYKEMKEAGIRFGIMNGRHSDRLVKPCHVEDAYMADLNRQSNGMLVGLAGVNFDQSIEDILTGLEKGIKELGMVGACMEPGLASEPMYAEDERLMPIYQKLADLDVPLLFMTGPFSGPDISYTDPVHFERVALNFPTLPIVLGHGCYPYVTKAITLSFKSGTGSENVYVSPDVYMFAPGGEAYVKAVSWLPERFLFASAYPFSGIYPAVERNLDLPILEDALPKFLHENAERILKL